MAKPRRISAKSCSFSIGNCRVEAQGNGEHKEGKDELQISFPGPATVKISVQKPRRYYTRNSLNDDLLKMQGEEDEGLSGNLSFVLVNPKEEDGQTQILLEEVVKLYVKELPMMSYAANTGKQSPFLERCVISGKYCTLLLKSDAIVGAEEVIGAITYQILPPDTQYAEIPLAAVRKQYQRKGFGQVVYRELKKRLQDVGVLTLFCWGDDESKGFWLKQGFLTVAEVDGKGKARKLPIKTDVRRAMCMPGNATLLVSHFKKKNCVLGNVQAVTPPRCVRSCSFLVPGIDPPKSYSKRSPVSHITTPVVTEAKPSSASFSTVKHWFEGNMGLNCKHISPTNSGRSLSYEGQETVMERFKASAVAQHCLRNDEINSSYIPHDGCIGAQYGSLGAGAGMANKSEDRNALSDSLLNFCKDGSSCDYKAVDFVKSVMDNSSKIQKVNVTCLAKKRGRKRIRSCELTYSMPVKVNNNCKEDPNMVTENNLSVGHTSVSMGGDVMPFIVESILREPLVEISPLNTQSPNISAGVCDAVAHALDTVKSSQGNPIEASEANIQQPVIMFMNMANDDKRIHLTKIVYDLGGSVSSDGNICTHVVTGQVRRTLNFCTALCSGAWVVSSTWLKESFKEHKFVGEMPFILKDKDFELKYETKVVDAVLRARARPHGLLNGFYVYLTPHIQPPLDALSTIINSAGGKVLQSLEEMQDPSHSILLACEEDMSEALAAAMIGMQTYTSDWFMHCIMRQELDFTASQFTVSL